MSGDVQPRKRKDKKRKKDDLGVEEPRGTAAALGEGDLFIHSGHDHGTGGHWCAKIIFFSLLAVLITLIGLIILENRGLSELEAHSVESRYSGVLEGWLEDAPDDDHHDEHTLELKHHDHLDDEDEHDIAEHSDDNEHDTEPDDDEEENSEELDQDEEGNQQYYEEKGNEGEIEEQHFSEQYYSNKEALNYNEADEDEKDSEDEEDGDEDNADEILEQEEYLNYRSYDKDEIANEDTKLDENYDNYEEDDIDVPGRETGESDEQTGYDEVNEKNHKDDDEDGEFENYRDANRIKDDDDHDDDDGDDDENASEEVERIEREVSEEETISTELPALPEQDDDDDDEQNDESKKEDDDDSKTESEDDEDEDFLEQVDDDDDGPPVEKITAPSGQPFDEIEEVVSSEKPPNTLDEEEEYEKKQEELRREEEQKSSHMWMKLLVGAALLVATQAVVRRATTSRDDSEENEEETPEEETPSVIDRRMTLLLNDPPVQEVLKKSSLETTQSISKDVPSRTPLIIKSSPTPKQVSQEDDEEDEAPAPKSDDKELFSDDEEEEEEDNEEIVPTMKIAPKQTATPTLPKETPKQSPIVQTSQPEPDDEDVGEDVEIIDEEQLEEEEEDDEEDISDVDDAELLTRLEEKYGRLPEPERPGARHKDGGNSMEDYWPSEPSDPYWHQQLEDAERELLQGRAESALARASAAELKTSARARWIVAQALDRMAEAKRDNRILSRAIAAYLEVLKMNQNMSDKKLLEVSVTVLDRIKFRGTYLSAEPVYRLLIRRFPNEIHYRNNLTVAFLMAGRSDLAEEVLQETLKLWPNDRVALAHYAFVLKTEHKLYEDAADLFKRALEGDTGPACEPRFYFHYGDALLLLGRFAEAHEVHKRGAAHGHFLSPEQRSLYNVDRLKSRPWWDVEKQTPYGKLARALEASWRDILKEGEAAKALYEQEKEGLRERGQWSQLDLFVRGMEIPGRCKRAPVTCSIVRSEVAAVGCRRGQIKFSSMEPGTHVRPHVGPTNCRLRMHLGLKNTKDTYIRVHKETRQWREGKVLLFDDSFEHEVWHNGTGTRLVLIVDLWHPDLTASERRQLPAI